MSFDDYLIKKAAGGEYARDFMAGMDPFGAYTSQYGQTAERGKASEKKHRAKQMLGTAGGLVGGGLLVPSAIGGITGGVKGVAKASGGAKAKLLAGITGAAQGFTNPVGGLLKARRAKGVTKKMVETGKVPSNLSTADRDALQFVANKTPVGAIVGQKGGVEGLESILKGEQNWDSILRQAETRAPGAQQYAEDARKRVEGDAAQFVMGEMDSLGLPDLKDLVDVQVVPGGLKIHPREGAGDIFKGKEKVLQDLEDRARARSKDVWERELESASSNPRMEEARNQVRKARMDALTTLDDQVGSAVSGGQAALGLGGAVGGAGAFVQYGKGRSTEQEFAGRQGGPGAFRLAKRTDPMQKSSSTSKSSFLTALLAPVTIGGLGGFAAGRRRRTKKTYVDLPGRLPKGKGKVKKVKIAYVQRDFIKEAHVLLDEHADGAWPFFYDELEKLAKAGRVGKTVEGLLARVRKSGARPRPKKAGNSAKLRKKLDDIKAKNADRPKPLTEEMREGKGSTEAFVRRKRKANAGARAKRNVPAPPTDVGPTLNAVPEVPKGLGLDSVDPRGSGRIGDAPTLVRPRPEAIPPPAQVPLGQSVSPATPGEARTVAQPMPTPQPTIGSSARPMTEGNFNEFTQNRVKGMRAENPGMSLGDALGNVRGTHGEDFASNQAMRGAPPPVAPPQAAPPVAAAPQPVVPQAQPAAAVPAARADSPSIQAPVQPQVQPPAKVPGQPPASPAGTALAVQPPAKVSGQPAGQPGMGPDWFAKMTPEQKAMMGGAIGVGGLGLGLAAGSGR